MTSRPRLLLAIAILFCVFASVVVALYCSNAQNQDPVDIALRIFPKCLEVQGPTQDSTDFIALVNACVKQSPGFLKLVNDIALITYVKGEKLKLGVGRNLPGVVTGNFNNQVIKSTDFHQIDLDDIEKFPQTAALDDIKKPLWATTQCMALAHELAETYYARKNSQSLLQEYHQCKLPADLFNGACSLYAKQIDDKKDQSIFRICHSYAIDIENKIREESNMPSLRQKYEAEAKLQTTLIVVIGSNLEMIFCANGMISEIRYFDQTLNKFF